MDAAGRARSAPCAWWGLRRGGWSWAGRAKALGAPVDNVQSVTAINFAQKVLEAPGPVAVEFMSYGCSHCKKAEPFVQEAAEKLAEAEAAAGKGSEPAPAPVPVVAPLAGAGIAGWLLKGLP